MTPVVRRMIRYGLAAATGALLFLACADFDIWPFAWFGFLPLLLALSHADLKDASKHAFGLGLVAGFVANAGGFYWINHLLMRFGQMPQVASFPIFVLLCIYQGLHWGLFAYIVHKLLPRWPAYPMVIVAPIVFVSCELIMPFIFDWYIAITQAWNVPVIQIADLTGPLGVSFLLMVANGALYDIIMHAYQHATKSTEKSWRLLAKKIIRPSAIGTTIIGAAFLYGAWRIHTVTALRDQAPKYKVGVVQANIGIVQKGRAELAAKHHDLHLRVSRDLQQRGAQLLVWPESSYPYAFERSMQRDYPADDPRRVMQNLSVPLLFGAVSYHRQSPYPYNSAYMINPDGNFVGRYDKNFLLIFGEYIPFYEYIPNFRQWFPAASNFARGTTVTTFPFYGHRIAPLICYEDILAQFGRRLAPLQPNLLVNVTNDAWFGQTSEPYEHLALSVYRSVELRLDMVRAVNTGVSAFIDATGRVTAQTKSYDPIISPNTPPEGLLHEAAIMPAQKTVFARIGNLFGYLNLIATLFLLWRRKSATW